MKEPESGEETEKACHNAQSWHDELQCGPKISQVEESSGSTSDPVKDEAEIKAHVRVVDQNSIAPSYSCEDEPAASRGRERAAKAGECSRDTTV